MHDYNLFADIKKLLIESHTKEEIKTLSTSELKKLHAKYMKDGTDEAKSEAEMIKKEIESRGKEKVEENFNTHTPLGSSIGSPDYAARVFAGASRQERLEKAAKERAARLAAEKEAKAKAEKKPVAEQNEELLAILDTLCEMVGLDMVALVEETRRMTRKDWENLGRASEWDRPAPAGAPHGKLAANARMLMVMAARARGTRSERAAREREEWRVGSKFAQRVADEGPFYKHNPETGGVVDNVEKADEIQNDIDGIEREVSAVENERKMSPTMRAHVENLRRLAKPAAKKTKGKGKGKK